MIAENLIYDNKLSTLPRFTMFTSTKIPEFIVANGLDAFVCSPTSPHIFFYEALEMSPDSRLYV